MIRVLAALLVAIASLSACQSDPGPAIAISDVRILAPMAGSNAGVAYLSIANNGTAPITISRIRSPQFDRVEMHETLVDDDGIARMQALERVEIPVNEVAEFVAGGKHLMLIGAGPDTAAGSPVTLEIEYNEGLLLVSATLQNRLPVE